MSLVQIENRPGLYRDTDSMAIINKDKTGYDNYMARKKISQDNKQKISLIENDINNVKTELNEIKNMLSILISRANY